MDNTAGPKQNFWPNPRNKYLAALAVIALVLSLMEILDFFELPFESFLRATSGSVSFLSVNLAAAISAQGYLALFVLMLLESASLPIPSEVVLPFAGYSVYLGTMNFWVALAVSTAAGVAGSLADYYLGLKLGRPIIYRFAKWFGISPTRLQDAEVWLNKRGSWSILLARFVPGIRSIISIPAGILEMRLSSFILMTFIGCAGWSAFLILLGYTSGPLWQAALVSTSLAATQALAYGVAVLSGLYIVFFALKHESVSRAGTIFRDPTERTRVLRISYWASFLKFNVVGLSGVLVNEGLLILFTLQGVYYLYSSGLAIEISILSNFLLNDYWTFRDRRSGHIAARLLKFNSLMMAGLAVNLAVVFLGTSYLGIHYALSNLIGILFAFFLRYILSVRYAWMKTKD